MALPTHRRSSSAIVTGGAGGFGSATARRLVQKGAKVVIADVSDERGEALAREVGSGCSSRRRSGYRSLGSSGPKPLGIVASDPLRGLCRPRTHRALLIDRVTTSLSDSMPCRLDKRRLFRCLTLCES